MKKHSILLSILKIFVLPAVFVLFSSCEDSIVYRWSEINESLGLLEDARGELEYIIYELEQDGYDTYGLEGINNRLQEVEDILDSNFY